MLFLGARLPSQCGHPHSHAGSHPATLQTRRDPDQHLLDAPKTVVIVKILDVRGELPGQGIPNTCVADVSVVVQRITIQNRFATRIPAVSLNIHSTRQEPIDPYYKAIGEHRLRQVDNVLQTSPVVCPGEPRSAKL